MSESNEVKLDRVQTAIAQIETGGIDVTYEGNRVTRADLKTLYDREAMLERKITRAARGGGIRVRQGVIG